MTNIKFDKKLDRFVGIPYPYKLICSYCSNEFTARRPEAKYCSNRCRQRAWQYIHKYVLTQKQSKKQSKKEPAKKELKEQKQFWLFEKLFNQSNQNE